ncbi:MAG TPA: enoyl-CoA hydratase/isomerase family protein [Stellaceae bacterium]|nr:enoyl-CoA hydratase/isomerase family protein [Stellaceae bacterium]
MSYEQLTYETEDRVAILTLNRPERMNALSKRLVEEIKAAIAAADADPEIRVLIVTGAGDKAFSAGYDIKESAEAPKRGLAEWRARMQQDIAFTYTPWDCSKPVIAMINGFCLAGALEFAQCCDIRYCADDARFGVVETRFANGIATLMMPWILGNRCRELIYTGDMFGAEEAHRLGLVDRVFPKAELRAETLKIAKRMARVALDCLKYNKRAINQSFEIMGLRSAIQYGSEICAVMDAVGSPEAAEFDRLRRAEGLAAALKWRDAQFRPFE